MKIFGIFVFVIPKTMLGSLFVLHVLFSLHYLCVTKISICSRILFDSLVNMK